MKRLAIFLDGTWNDPEDSTNVWRLRTLIAERDGAGVVQRCYYDRGVGTGAFDRLRGGVLGKGLSKNILEAYRWLVEEYEPGDEIFVFGFSRGAYTARSLAGLIAKCGLLSRGAPLSLRQVYRRYRTPDALPHWELSFRRDQQGEDPPSREAAWILDYSPRVPIKLVGVWDTVGALGVPFGDIPGLSRSQLKFHHTRLSNLFEHSCHALAIDEHREDYGATLWTRFRPSVPDPEPEDPQRFAGVEQRWFLGAHSNVGGGYEADPLARIPLAWMQSKATAAGLVSRQAIQLAGDEFLAEPRDSYAEFLRGAYRLARRRFHRPIAPGPRSVRGGTSEPVNEVLDESVIRRWQEDSSYRPPAVRDWARRHGRDPESLMPTEGA